MGKENWNYDERLGIRIDKATRDRLWQESEVIGVPLSQHIRDILTKARLPEQFLLELPDQHRQRIEQHAQKKDRELGEILLTLVRLGIPYAMDKGNVGF